MAEARRALALNSRTQRRPHAVGADQRQAAFLDDALVAARLHRDAVDVGGEVLDVAAELERDVLRALRGTGERRLQVAAMDRPIGRAVAALGVVAQRNAHDLAAGAARHHADRLRRHDGGRQLFAQAERDQHAGGVGRELDSGAGLFELGGLFEHGCAQAGARQRQRRRQPRDAGAGDDDMTRGRQGSELRFWIRRRR